jgi:SAM-dependent methyltransferase
MLERARRRLEQEGLTQVRLYQADMVDLHELPDEIYRLAIVALNGFLHVPDRVAQQRALRELHRVLRAGGLLVLDVLHPTPEQLRALEQPLAWDGSWQLPDGSRLDRFASRSVQAAEQTITTTFFYDRTDGKTGAVERRVATYTLRYIHRFELELLLETAGFDIEAVYGSYDLEPLTDDSPLLLVVAQRRVGSAILARR